MRNGLPALRPVVEAAARSRAPPPFARVDEPAFVVFNPHSGKGRAGAVRRAGAAGARPGEAPRARPHAGPGRRGAPRRGGDPRAASAGSWRWAATARGATSATRILRAGAPASAGPGAGRHRLRPGEDPRHPPRDVGACCRIVLEGETRTIDVGRIEDRHFLNIAGFGYDVAVLEDSWSVGYLEGGALYLYCALRQLGSYRGFSLEGEVDGRPLGKRDMLMVIVANARVFGGGFRVAPHADLEDGKLEAVAFANMGLGGRVSALVGLLRGTHLKHPRVTAVTASRIVYRFAAPPAYETDGEWNQARTADVVVEAVPKALRVLVPGAMSGSAAGPAVRASAGSRGGGAGALAVGRPRPRRRGPAAGGGSGRRAGRPRLLRLATHGGGARERLQRLRPLRRGRGLPGLLRLAAAGRAHREAPGRPRRRERLAAPDAVLAAPRGRGRSTSRPR